MNFKKLLSIVVLFSLFCEGEMGRFNLQPSTVDTECETVLLNNIGWGCDDLRARRRARGIYNIESDAKPAIISLGQICDGVVDCPNGRDEQCTEDTNEYQCSITYTTSIVCDGFNHCHNKADESSCFEDEFSCDNGSVQLNSRQICNQRTDCVDGTDETALECLGRFIPGPLFTCKRVVFSRSFCGRYGLCGDGSDRNCVQELCGFMDCEQLTWFDYTANKCHCACHDGYNMDENSTCISTEIDCGPPPPLSNGNISFTNGTKYRSIATYTCNSEHELLGVSQRKCGRDGMWTGKEPSCVPQGSIIATCKRPIDIQNGNITVFITPGGARGFKNGRNEQQQAVYQCDDGYTLIGNSTRDCNDGRWEGLAPQCIRNETRCEVPSLNIDDGSISSPCQPGEGALEGTVLQYSCDPGYTLDGLRNVTCGKDGVWSSALPSCKLCALDVIFAIDDSSSISGKQFRGLKTFLANVVDSLDIGEDDVRIGVIKYAKGVKDEIRLDDFFGKKKLKAAVLKIKHERGGTRTGRAITRMVKAFQGGFGGRVGAQKIGIVITDGKSKDSVTRPVMRAERAGITLYAIGVGGSVDRPEIRTIAGDRSRAFFSTSFSTLNRVIQELTIGFGC